MQSPQVDCVWFLVNLVDDLKNTEEDEKEKCEESNRCCNHNYIF